MTGMTYAGSGVDYDAMDPFKRMALRAALTTDTSLERLGFSVVPWSRGESVTLIETPWCYLGFLVEGLGTKNLVADAMRKLLDVAVAMERLVGKRFYWQVAHCNVAMNLNDLITLGVRPIGFGQYLAVGESKWFEDEDRAKDLIEGTANACRKGRVAWLGGETPTLKDIIVPGASDLAGATFGIVPDKSKVLNPAKIQDGDAIVFLTSRGLNANGYTLARAIAAKLSPDPERPELGYLTEMPNGELYGEALLKPTPICVKVVEDCLDAGIDIHYAVNMTGHGWRKLMRATQPHTYVIDRVPEPPTVFKFVQEHGPVSDNEAFKNLNMGTTLALYLPDGQVGQVSEVINRYRTRDYDAFHAGHIEAGEKRVVIVPKSIEFKADTLQVR